MLELVHLVESARYHLCNLDNLTSGKGEPPPNFETGVDFAGKELELQWRVMASLIEFEGFLTAGKRFLDRAWCCLGERLGPCTSEIRTLGGAIYKSPKVVDEETKKFLAECSYFSALRAAWNDWGQQLADMRNYVEHQAPLGGRSFGFSQIVENVVITNLFIPDEIPSAKQSVPKRNLTFARQVTANAYAHEVMKKLDLLMADLLAKGLFLAAM